MKSLVFFLAIFIASTANAQNANLKTSPVNDNIHRENKFKSHRSLVHSNKGDTVNVGKKQRLSGKKLSLSDRNPK